MTGWATKRLGEHGLCSGLARLDVVVEAEQVGRSSASAWVLYRMSREPDPRSQRAV